MTKTYPSQHDIAVERLRSFGWRPLPDKVVREATQRYIALGEVDRINRENQEIAEKDRKWQAWDIYNKKPLPPIDQDPYVIRARELNAR